MSLTYGNLFAGYGGLEAGVQSVLGGTTSWFAEFDKAPSRILAHHHPGVPNLGDVTKVDWATVPKVDVITGGSPCQDLSHAGKRKGMTDGTRSNLWVEMREAIAVIRPRLVVWENVRGALSAEAASDLEQCPRCVGDPRDRGPVLRALGRVVGDLADLRYVGSAYGLRAADVGAPHGRFRIFLFATPADADLSGLEGRWAGGERRGERPVGAGRVEAGPEPIPGQLTLLPTPAAHEPGGTAEQYHARLTRHDGRESTFLPLSMAVQLLPPQDWREYEPAIRRWEHVLGRPAPAPTEPGAKGQPRLSPAFVEFLMGLPEGHVTDPAIGISRNDQLKALGNGVVSQQCAAATRAFIHDAAKEAAA